MRQKFRSYMAIKIWTLIIRRLTFFYMMRAVWEEYFSERVHRSEETK